MWATDAGPDGDGAASTVALAEILSPFERIPRQPRYRPPCGFLVIIAGSRAPWLIQPSPASRCDLAATRMAGLLLSRPVTQGLSLRVGALG